MIYLNKGFFAPIFLFINFVFAPLFILCWFLTIRQFDIAIFCVSLTMSFVWFLSSFGLWKYSKSKKNYMYAEENKLYINYPNLTTESLFQISINQIIRIEYYKFNSIRAWSLICNNIGPRSAFITYFEGEDEVCKLIGYPKIDEIKDLCSKHKITIVLK